MSIRHLRGQSRSACSVLFVLLTLAACGSAGPPPKQYVLGDAVLPRSDSISQLGSFAEVKRVRLPDYLDTTDIVTRGTGGEVVASQSARWAERLSLNVTRAFAESLQARLPESITVTTVSREDPRWQVLIDIDAFEARTGGRCVLVGRWSVWDGRGLRKLREEGISLSESVELDSDAKLVAAMTREVEQLADRVAPALRGAVVP